MATKRTSRLRHRGRVDLWLGLLSSAVLGAMMLFIFVSALLRYGFNAPIVGANEVLSLAAVAMVMLGLPLVTTRDAHVRIDLLDGALGRWGKAVTDALYRVIALVVLWFLTRAYVLRTLDAYEFEDTTNMLDAVIWPFYALVAFGMGAYALILAGQLVRMVIRR
jgi:TRAP-type C4-dicarboxylate transport system permease small subunit